MKTTKVLGVGLALGLGSLLGACAVDTAPDRPGESVLESDDELRNRIFCGGIAGLPCPDGYTCVDDPTDNCNPAKGGADCAGYCKKAKPSPSACKADPSKTYISTDPNQCAVIKFFCAEGEPFFDDCGCGCQTKAGVTCGTATCGAGEYCCNESCSICAPEGGFCTMQFCG
jgi:hypothetical protein